MNNCHPTVSLPLKDEIYFYTFWWNVEKQFSNTFGLHETQVLSALEQIKNTFRNSKISDFSKIDFDNPNFICAYLRYYSGAHFGITRISIMEFLIRCHFICPYFYIKLSITPVFKIVSVGGGPGNDLYGFCSALSSWKRNCCFQGCLLKKHVRLTILDLRKNWEWAARIAHYKFHSSTSGMTTSSPYLHHNMAMAPNYRQVDLSELNQRLCVRTEIQSADVVLMVKVLSVMEPQAKSAVLMYILTSLSVGGIFCYIDCEKNRVVDIVAQLNALQNCFQYEIIHNMDKRLFVRQLNNFPNTMRISSFEVIMVQKKLRPQYILNPWLHYLRFT